MVTNTLFLFQHKSTFSHFPFFFFLTHHKLIFSLGRQHVDLEFAFRHLRQPGDTQSYGFQLPGRGSEKAALEQGHINRTTRAHYEDGALHHRDAIHLVRTFQTLCALLAAVRGTTTNAEADTRVCPKVRHLFKAFFEAFSWVCSTSSACRLDRKQHKLLQRRRDEIFGCREMLGT